MMTRVDYTDDFSIFRHFRVFFFEALLIAAFTVCFLSGWIKKDFLFYSPATGNLTVDFSVKHDTMFLVVMFYYFVSVFMIHIFVAWIDNTHEGQRRIRDSISELSDDDSDSSEDPDEQDNLETNNDDDSLVAISSHKNFEEDASNMVKSWSEQYGCFNYTYETFTIDNPNIICVRYSNDIAPIFVDRLVMTIQNTIKKPYTVIDQSLFTTQYCGNSSIRSKSISLPMFRRLISDLRKGTVVELFSSNILRPAPTLIICGDVIGEEIQNLEFNSVMTIFLSGTENNYSFPKHRKISNGVVDISLDGFDLGCAMVSKMLERIYYKDNETPGDDDSNEDLDNDPNEKSIEINDEDYRNDHQKQE